MSWKQIRFKIEVGKVSYLVNFKSFINFKHQIMTRHSSFLSFMLISMTLLFTACGEPQKEVPAAEPAVVAAPVEPAKPDMAQVKTEIQAAENAWAAALNARDLNALMALYADDAVNMANNAPMLVGKAAIQQHQEKDFKTMPAGMTFTFETMDVFGDGNIVTETGKTTYKDAAGKVTGTGKYMAVFEKRDGKYLCIREIYNSDKKNDKK